MKAAVLLHSSPDEHLHLPLDSTATGKFQTDKSLQGKFTGGPTNLSKLKKSADHHSSLNNKNILVYVTPIIDEFRDLR